MQHQYLPEKQILKTITIIQEPTQQADQPATHLLEPTAMKVAHHVLAQPVGAMVNHLIMGLVQVAEAMEVLLILDHERIVLAHPTEEAQVDKKNLYIQTKYLQTK